jgi:hypothetical protein
MFVMTRRRTSISEMELNRPGFPGELLGKPGRFRSACVGIGVRLGSVRAQAERRYRGYAIVRVFYDPSEKSRL